MTDGLGPRSSSSSSRRPVRTWATAAALSWLMAHERALPVAVVEVETTLAAGQVQRFSRQAKLAAADT
jgi:hypothetical protein